MVRLTKIAIVMVILASMNAAALGTTYYVDPDGSDDADGLSWATAFATIQKGIDTASSGDEVDVNEGTYNEAIELKDYVDLKGAGRGKTIIRSNLPDDATTHTAVVNGAAFSDIYNLTLEVIDRGPDSVESYEMLAYLYLGDGDWGIYNCDLYGREDAIGWRNDGLNDAIGKVEGCNLYASLIGVDVYTGFLGDMTIEFKNCVIDVNGVDLAGYNDIEFSAVVLNGLDGQAASITADFYNCFLSVTDDGSVQDRAVSALQLRSRQVASGEDTTANCDRCVFSTKKGDDPNNQSYGIHILAHRRDSDNNVNLYNCKIEPLDPIVDHDYDIDNVDDDGIVKVYNTDYDSYNGDSNNLTILCARNVGTGDAWEDEYYESIQAAINDTDDGNNIEVAKGIHYGAIDFDGKAITLRSTDPGVWDIVEATIIDANGANRAVKFDSGEDGNSVLSGFTVRNASLYGVDCDSSSPVIKRCIIEDSNGAGAAGIRVYNASPKITGNQISNNAQEGIIILNGGPSPNIDNNWIFGNQDGIVALSGTPTIRNNTIVNNSDHGIQKAISGNPTIISCILWDNDDDLSDCSATYSCIEDGDSGTGNISSAPCFVDTNNLDYHIDVNSPCVNAGDPNTTGAGEIDIDGQSRVLAGRVDMGADETGELVGCRDFSCSTGWEFETEDCWRIDDGNAIFEGDYGHSDTLYQNIAVEAGREYRVKFKITDWIDEYDEDGSELWVYFGNFPSNSQTIVTLWGDGGGGNFSYDVTVGAGISGRINFDATAGTESEAYTYIELDDVSVVEIP